MSHADKMIGRILKDYKLTYKENFHRKPATHIGSVPGRILNLDGRQIPGCASSRHIEISGVQGKFWEMQDKLYENQKRLGEALYLDLAEKLKLSTTALRQALEQRTYEARVRAYFRGGVRSGVNGTPTFVINGHRHDGSFDFETLVSAIHQAMVTAKSA